MSIIDTYRRNVQRKKDELIRLQNDKAKEQKKISDLSTKIIRASDSIKRTSSSSTINSKVREIDRYQRESNKCEKKISDIENKISRKQREINDEQKKVDREVAKESQKRIDESRRQQQEYQKKMNTIDQTLNSHQSMIKKLQELPEKIVVLFFASNPLDQIQLRLDEEVRSISEMIRKAKHRDSISFESCWAVRPIDILQGLNEHQPAIVHFSGHGSDQDELVVQDNNGNTKVISKEAIVQTMMASSEGIRLVFFNTCYSKNQAEAVVEHVEAAIGMNTSIGDDAARVFASQFYSSIGFGFSLKKSFEQAKALLMLENINEEDTPELFVNDGLDPEEIFIVKPQETDQSI